MEDLTVADVRALGEDAVVTHHLNRALIRSHVDIQETSVNFFSNVQEDASSDCPSSPSIEPEEGHREKRHKSTHKVSMLVYALEHTPVWNCIRFASPQSHVKCIYILRAYALCARAQKRGATCMVLARLCGASASCAHVHVRSRAKPRRHPRWFWTHRSNKTPHGSSSAQDNRGLTIGPPPPLHSKGKCPRRVC